MFSKYKLAGHDTFYFFTSLSSLLIILSFLFSIIDEMIKLVDHIFNNTLFGYIKFAIAIELILL